MAERTNLLKLLLLAFLLSLFCGCTLIRSNSDITNSNESIQMNDSKLCFSEYINQFPYAIELYDTRDYPLESRLQLMYNMMSFNTCNMIPVVLTDIKYSEIDGTTFVFSDENECLFELSGFPANNFDDYGRVNEIYLLYSELINQNPGVTFYIYYEGLFPECGNINLCGIRAISQNPDLIIETKDCIEYLISVLPEESTKILTFDEAVFAFLESEGKYDFDYEKDFSKYFKNEFTIRKTYYSDTRIWYYLDNDIVITCNPFDSGTAIYTYYDEKTNQFFRNPRGVSPGHGHDRPGLGFQITCLIPNETSGYARRFETLVYSDGGLYPAWMGK